MDRLPTHALCDSFLFKEAISKSKCREDKGGKTNKKQVFEFYILEKRNGMESKTNGRKEEETGKEARGVPQKRESSSKTISGYNKKSK